MGTGNTVDGVSIRDAQAKNQFADVTAAGELVVTGDVTPQPTVVAVPTVAVVSVDTNETLLLAASAARIFAVIQNHGTEVLQIRFSAGGSSVLLLPQYGSLVLRSDDVLVTGAIYGIRDTLTENAGVVSG